MLKVTKSLAYKRNSYIHKVTTEIINREPKFIAVENLNVKGMMSNRHLAKAIQEQSLAEFERQLQYKCSWNGIPYIKVDKWFPSSKLCNSCGSIKKDLKLSDRVYRCSCGNVIDRDYNAACNIRDEGERILRSQVA